MQKSNRSWFTVELLGAGLTTTSEKGIPPGPEHKFPLKKGWKITRIIIPNPYKFYPRARIYFHNVNNENGSRLLKLDCRRNMVISSTCSPHIRIQKRTLAPSNGPRFNQIDQPLSEKQAASTILDMSSYRRENCENTWTTILSRQDIDAR